jgi:MinD-like ATPase involved in chromosome partitioning or flagellar assembly
MDANDAIKVLEWLAKVVASAGVVLAAIWRILDGMITKKVQAQISALSAEITKTSSESMQEIRDELRDNRKEQREEIRGIRDRIDKLFDQGHGGR